MASEGQKQGWDDLQGSAYRLLGVIIYYNRRIQNSECAVGKGRILEDGKYVCMRKYR